VSTIGGRASQRGPAGRLFVWVEPWYAAFFLANLVMGASSILIPLKLDRILHQGPSHLGLLSSVSSTAAVVGSLVWGRLSDAVHRRKAFVVISYLAVGVSHCGLALSTTYAGLLMHNALLSLFWVANASVAVLLVIEGTDQRIWESRISALNLSGALGWLLGLAAGGSIVSTALSLFSDRLGIQVLLLALGVMALAAAGLASWLLPATKPMFTERRFRGIIVAVGNLLLEAWRFNPLHLYHRFSLRRVPALRKETKLFLLASFLAFAGIGFFAVPLVLLLTQRLGFPPSMVFFSYVLLHSGIALAYPFALHRIRKQGNRRIQIGALSVRLVLFVLAAGLLWSSIRIPWAVAAPFLFVVGVTWSFFQLSGVALASRLAAPENRGLALGTYNAVAGGSTIIAGVASGFLAQHVGYHATHLAAAALLLAAILVLGRLPDPAPPSSAVDEESLRPRPAHRSIGGRFREARE
jgi:MFS family permease